MTRIDNFAPSPAADTAHPAEPLTGPLVVALVYDGLCTFEFAIVAEVFGLSRPEMGPGWYRYASAAIEPGPLRAHGGLTVVPTAGLELLAQADLIVAAGWKGADVPVPEALAEALRQAWARGARLASICSGAFVLAATGLLAGRRAATHWRYADTLRRRHPEITVDAGVLYAQEERLYTSAGSAAGIDLMLHIVRQDYGSRAANSVARRLVMPPHRGGGQAQFIERPVPRDTGHHIAGAIEAVRADLRAPWNVERMAEAAAMSPRTFLRRFTEATSQAPGQWLIDERVAEAQRLLESSRLPIEGVADAAGFGSVQSMRHHFQAKLAVTPGAYRRMFTVTHPGAGGRALPGLPAAR
ncbi:transcriptional regulator FtrA [Acidovorax sp. GBBC 3334]|uniref:transcriptional regulator FtrA n=1 Tax=Acidovorax sp. GBBC 3334 TaxID=2940496 RepID=UPI002303240F|nr:transcriptional regulator FtrA [Acidovorax sp. GBBC 3334]MDA8457178.1 transcriptional regulator FtrA [Acidovorax sp. GBBC 3334]